MEKGRIEFDDPNYRPATLDEKREQVRKGSSDLVRYNNATRPADPSATEQCERCGYHDASKCTPDCPYEFEPADRAAKCPVCPKCLSDVCDCQFAATEKCECGHGKHAHDANQCYSVLSVTQTQCLCKSYRPPAPEPADANANEAARAFKRVAFELRMRFPVEIQYNSEFEAMVKRLEAGSL